jgi:hypothetical protein
VDHGGNVEYEEGARDPMKHAPQCGGPIQFRAREFDFESNSESRTFLVLCHLFWADGLCIELESARDTSYGSAMTPSLIYSVAAIAISWVCLD